MLPYARTDAATATDVAWLRLRAVLDKDTPVQTRPEMQQYTRAACKAKAKQRIDSDESHGCYA